jgi:hypothetical protein
MKVVLADESPDYVCVSTMFLSICRLQSYSSVLNGDLITGES